MKETYLTVMTAESHQDFETSVYHKSCYDKSVQKLQTNEGEWYLAGFDKETGEPKWVKTQPTPEKPEEKKCDKCGKVIESILRGAFCKSGLGYEFCSSECMVSFAEPEKPEEKKQEYVLCGGCSKHFYKADMLPFDGRLYCKKCWIPKMVSGVVEIAKTKVSEPEAESTEVEEVKELTPSEMLAYMPDYKRELSFYNGDSDVYDYIERMYKTQCELIRVVNRLVRESKLKVE